MKKYDLFERSDKNTCNCVTISKYAYTPNKTVYKLHQTQFNSMAFTLCLLNSNLHNVQLKSILKRKSDKVVKRTHSPLDYSKHSMTSSFEYDYNGK